VTVIGFTVATWGLFRRTGWWEPVASASAVVSLTTLLALANAIDTTSAGSTG
jgi:CHASE2 domain-containing sensor protein